MVFKYCSVHLLISNKAFIYFLLKLCYLVLIHKQLCIISPIIMLCYISSAHSPVFDRPFSHQKKLCGCPFALNYRQKAAPFKPHFRLFNKVVNVLFKRSKICYSLLCDRDDGLCKCTIKKQTFFFFFFRNTINMGRK